jgi:hypothetical protein
VIRMCPDLTPCHTHPSSCTTQHICQGVVPCADLNRWHYLVLKSMEDETAKNHQLLQAAARTGRLFMAYYEAWVIAVKQDPRTKDGDRDWAKYLRKHDPSLNIKKFQAYQGWARLAFAYPRLLYIKMSFASIKFIQASLLRYLNGTGARRARALGKPHYDGGFWKVVPTIEALQPGVGSSNHDMLTCDHTIHHKRRVGMVEEGNEWMMMG